MVWWLIAAFLGLSLVVFLALPVVLEMWRAPVDKKARTQAPGQFASLSRGLTHYRWHGHIGGPVAVCIHGLSTSSYVWGVIEEMLISMGFRVLTYDLYGRGFSDRPGGDQTPEFFVEQLEDLLEDQGVEDEITLLGYSMGGAVAAAFAAHAPDRLERLVLIAPAGLGHDLGRLASFAVRWPVLGGWLYTVFGAAALRRGIRAEAAGPKPVIEGIHDMQAAETRTKGYLPAILSSLRHMMSRDQIREHKEIAATDLPVLAIWGEADAVIPIAGVGVLAEIHRDAHQVQVPGAPHSLAYTHPNEIRAALQEFMRDGL